MKRIQIATSVFLIACLSPGCVETVMAQVGSHMVQTSSDNLLLTQIQAYRLDQGLSLKEFEQEMWEYVPVQYAQIQIYRLESGDAKLVLIEDNGRNAMARSPEREAQYVEILKRRDEFTNTESFWDLNSMMYRAIRMQKGATDKVVIEELLQSDVKFARRYQSYQKR